MPQPKICELSSSAFLADGPGPAHLIGVAFLILLVLLPACWDEYLDQKRGSPQGASWRSAASSRRAKAGEVMLLREKSFSLASMLILMWWRAGLTGGTLRFHPTQTLPSYQVRSRQRVSKSFIWVCSLWISPSIEFSSSSSPSTPRPFNTLFRIQKTIHPPPVTHCYTSTIHPSHTPTNPRQLFSFPPRFLCCLLLGQLWLISLPLIIIGMGQTDSRVAVREGWHQKFGKVELLADPTQPQTVLIRTTLSYQDFTNHYPKWSQMVKALRTSSIAHHLILPLTVEDKQCLVCTLSDGNSGLKLTYSLFRNSLQQEVKSRREIGHLFPEYQLWYLLLVLLRVAAFFEQESSYVGNLHPSNVFLDDHGAATLFTVFSAPHEPENWQRIRSSKYEDAFLAPQQLPLLEEEEEVERRVEQSRVDLFNIGLVLLSAALLKDFYSIYTRRQHFSLNAQKLEAYKEELNELGALKYRKTLRCFIMQLLTVDPLARGTPSQHLALLRPHEQQILQLVDFHPQELFVVEASPQVVNYRQSPHSRGSRFISLSTQHNSKKSKQMESILQKALYRPAKVDRKLFQEQ